MYAARRGLVARRCPALLWTSRRGEFRPGLDLGSLTGLRDFWLNRGRPLDPLGRDMVCPEYLSAAEFARVEGVEFPESELMLCRRVLIGIRDCEPRLAVPPDPIVGLGDSRRGGCDG